MRDLYLRYREVKGMIDLLQSRHSSGTLLVLVTIAVQPSSPSRQNLRSPPVDYFPQKESSPKPLGGSKSPERSPQKPRYPISSFSFRTFSNQDYLTLRAEKRRLQVKLHEYQNEFVAKTGRKVQSREDRLPVQREYERYRELRVILAELEQNSENITSM